MLNYIVLGQVPGTDYFLNFTSIITMYAIVFLVAIVIILTRQAHDLSDVITQNITQPYEKSPKNWTKIFDLLPARWTPLAIWIIIRYSSVSRRQLQNYVSSQNPGMILSA